MTQLSNTLVWLRRDLRWDDNASLAKACEAQGQFWVVFVFDRTILDALTEKQDRRVEFIWEAVETIKQQFEQFCGELIVLYGHAHDEIPKLAQQLGAKRVICARDYEALALARDQTVKNALEAIGCAFEQVKDHVIFERQEVMSLASKPYSVFTPYKNAWLKKLSANDLNAFDAELSGRIAQTSRADSKKLMPSLESMGFTESNLKSLKIPISQNGAQQLFTEFKERIHGYGDTRDFPAIKGPSYLSVHLRFGTISIRQLARAAHSAYLQADPSQDGAYRWLSELIWRDFYFQILSNFPRAPSASFKAEYDLIQWDQDEALFQAWCAGKTGYPLIDAAMLQLNTSGYMHNRLRMVVASFLTKDLGIDWRWGERYFAQMLNDFDLSANNGGWQWAASSGCDAQPYFRIFNPTSQSEKFDPEGVFIKRYLPQLADLSKKDIHSPWLCTPLTLKAAGITLGADYPFPVVEHDKARLKTLARYAVVKKNTEPV